MNSQDWEPRFRTYPFRLGSSSPPAPFLDCRGVVTCVVEPRNIGLLVPRALVECTERTANFQFERLCLDMGNCAGMCRLGLSHPWTYMPSVASIYPAP